MRKKLPYVICFLTMITFVTYLVWHLDHWITRIKKDFEEDTKPLFVIGILTTEKTTDRRTAQRETWISTLTQLKNQLPFRIIYKFLFDKRSKISMLEDRIYHDIVYLNVSHHGWANRYGEKMYKWLTYIHKNFPGVTVGAKMDDDVFLCVPQLMNRLYELKSSTLYYGWKHTYPAVHIDEMFVVIGMELIDRIVKRKYCGKPNCPKSDDLAELNFGDLSLYRWLSIYNDIDEHSDNPRIIHIGGGKLWAFKNLISKDSCLNYVLFHKALPRSLRMLYNKTKEKTFHFQKVLNYQNDNVNENTKNIPLSKIYSPGAVTGRAFSGSVIRNVTVQSSRSYPYIAGKLTGEKCDDWAIVTTLSLPSSAVKHVASFKNWCLLIVADLKTAPKIKYLENLKGDSIIKYLSIEEQKFLYPALFDVIPFNHYSRKNIGYMYAIHHRAKLIWDFDDDNFGIIERQYLENMTFVKVCSEDSKTLMNPYPYFGVQETHSWPRGFPLQEVKVDNSLPKICNITENPNVGIVQSLANREPDVDAIYRFTREVPFNFTATTVTHRPMLIPKEFYSPFNTQATMWFESAFEYLPLPVSVNGRVSDIWRSYVAQYFMHTENIHLIFTPPYVIQERNPHNLLKDFNGELDLYEKSKQLVEFLVTAKSMNITMLSVMYEHLYVRNYIEEGDLLFIRAWEETLSNIKTQAS